MEIIHIEHAEGCDNVVYVPNAARPYRIVINGVGRAFKSIDTVKAALEKRDREHKQFAREIDQLILKQLKNKNV